MFHNETVVQAQKTLTLQVIQSERKIRPLDNKDGGRRAYILPGVVSACLESPQMTLVRELESNPV
jgi:hypothetical protein